MKDIKVFNKFSALALGTTALFLSNISQCNAQQIQVQTTHNLNLRSGTSTNDAIILTLKKGTNIDIIESQGQWTKIKYKNHIGFVSSQYLKIITTEDNLLNNENKYQADKVKIMECRVDLLNIRFGPSSSEKIIDILQKGDKVEILYEVNNTWARIKYNGGYGYVNMRHLNSKSSNSAPDNSGFMKCRVNLLNIRVGPSSSEKIIGQLEKDDIIEIIYHVSTGWTKIKYANGYAYVNTSYLTTA